MIKRLFLWLIPVLLLCASCVQQTAPPDDLSAETGEVPNAVGQLTIPAQPAPAPEEEVPDDLPEEEPVEIPAPDPAEEAALRLLSSMTLEEQVGQLLLIGCPSDRAEEILTTYPLGGYILFAHHFEGKDAAAVQAMTAALQNASRVPLLLAVDEEGGSVVRVSRYTSLRQQRFAAPRTIYESGGMDAVLADANEKSEFLLNLGLNVNLAPVCDLSDDPEDFIYSRSFGGDPALVSDYVSQVVQVMHDAGIGSVLKHFPGYGSCGDTHTGIVVDQRSADEILEEAILPFRAGVAQGAGAVMVCHMIMEAFDSQRPASLSPAVYELLREQLGDDVVVMTDDLDMGGITDYTDGADASVSAILAGCDLILSSDYQTHYQAVLTAVQEGIISESRLAESVLRVLKWKYQLGLLA